MQIPILVYVFSNVKSFISLITNDLVETESFNRNFLRCKKITDYFENVAHQLVNLEFLNYLIYALLHLLQFYKITMVSTKYGTRSLHHSSWERSDGYPLG